MNVRLPLITLEALSRHGTEALPVLPPAFCTVWQHLPDEDEPASGVTVWAVGKGRKTATMTTSAIQTAIILEVTRFGGSITPNRNTPTKSLGTTYYPKVIFPDASEDNLPVHRLLGGAEAGERINLDLAIPSDLRGAIARKTGGASKKGAWATGYGHCKRYAENAAAEGEPLPFTVEEYLANLEALYFASLAQFDEKPSLEGAWEMPSADPVRGAEAV